MEADNKKLLEEIRMQLKDCGYERTDYKLYAIQNIYSMEWWIADEDKQILIVVGDHSEFNLFRFIGDTFSSVQNLQAIAAIAFQKQPY